jgi:type II secretory pathway component PulF
MVIFMMIFIVPRITESFEKAGSQLPGLTQMIVNISNFFLNDW